MVKLVDTLVSGASAHKLAGSSPVPGTKNKTLSILEGVIFFTFISKIFSENKISM